MLPKSKTIKNSETIDLIKQYQESKDVEVRNKILLGNLGLIYQLAHKYRVVRSHHNFDDFVSEGIIGMIEAIEKFDLARKNNFSTYAYWRILKRINESVSIGTLGLPQHRINIYRAYEKTKTTMLNDGEDVSIEEIAKKIGVSVKVLADTVNKKDDISIDAPSEISIKMVSTSDFEDGLLDSIDFERAATFINDVLSDREKEVINYRFGLGDVEPLTLKEISEKMNVSTECIRVVQNKSLKKIKIAYKKRAMSKR